MKDPGTITCPVTRSTWPAVARFELKTCGRCGGIIDVRREAWSDGPFHATCPKPLLGKGKTAGAGPSAPAVPVDKADPTPGDDVHAARLEELRRAEVTP